MRNWKKGWRTLLWCVLMCAHVMSIAQVYTWTDKDGRKHFGDPATTFGTEMVGWPSNAAANRRWLAASMR